MEHEGTMEHCEEDEEGGWYDNDLQLAAELGKALLERNRELESQVLQYQQIAAEQELETEYLSRQLENMRETTETRNRIYEEIDKSMQELEKANQKLVIDAKADKQRTEKLCETVETLEEKNDELVKKVDELKAAERERKKMQKQQNKDTRRARSLANLPDNKENKDRYFEQIGNWAYTEGFKNSNLPLNPYEIEIRNLQEILKQMKGQQLLDRRKKEEYETEVNMLWEENTSLEVKVKMLEDDLVKYKKLQDEIQKIKLESGKYCVNCGKTLGLNGRKNTSKLESEVEDDDPSINSAGKLVKLESGGSVYGSRESLDQVAMDSKETMTSICTPDDYDQAGISILNELETQYQHLFKKYELLLQKGRRPGSLLLDEDEKEEDWQKRLAHKGVQTLLNLHKTDLQDVAGCGTGETGQEFENPPYKTIFRDIFATLKKSRIEESGETSVASPSDGTATAKTPGKGNSNATVVPDGR